MSSNSGFSDAERAAMKERAEELKRASTGGKGSKAAREEAALLEKIAAMDDSDRLLAERVHAIVTENAPHLAPKLWYGQPAYAAGGKIVCFFRSGHDDGERYSTFGFTPNAHLDDAAGLWPTSFALAEMTMEAEKTLIALIAKASG